MDEFEKLLQRQPLRDVPTEWKTEILIAQRTAGRGKNAAPTNGVAWWREWLWPSPVAWAGLACVWLIIFALNFAARPTTGERDMARRSPVPSQEIAIVLAEHRRELAELRGSLATPSTAIRQPDPPGPRSDCAATVLAV